MVRMIQSAPCLSRVVPKMHRIRVAEHLGASSRRPRHPRALDDEELFIIEGSPGAQRPDGRSAKKARKTGEKPLSHRHRHKVRNPIFSTTCSCGISAVSATTCDCGACTTNTTGTSTTFQMYCNCEISMVWGIDLHRFLHYLDHRHQSLTTAGMSTTCHAVHVATVESRLSSPRPAPGTGESRLKLTTCTCGTCTTCTTKRQPHCQ